MAILTCNDLSIAFGSHHVLDGVSLDIDKGERLCITGRNGSGKSTLLRLIAGDLQPDEGSIWRSPGLDVSTLAQALPMRPESSVYDFVAEAFHEIGKLLARHHRLLDEIDRGDFGRAQQDELDRIHRALDHAGGWTSDHKIQSILDRFGLDSHATLAKLSGGWLRRASMARSLVTGPDLWLLDEPTNHLDIPTIAWLEQEMLSFAGTIVFISHDRRLIQTVATAIVDLDRGHLTRWDCDYATFVERRAHQREVEQTHNREFDRILAKEEAWIRKGVEARRTRNEGRVRALEKMRAERRQRRVARDLKLEVDAGGRSGKLVKELTAVCKSWGDQCVIKDLDLIVLRGDRVGLLGPNGAGKSTLLKILLGEIQPDSGSVKTGTRLDVAYFDQVREEIDPDATVAEAIAEGREYVSINGRDTHVVTWLGNFLFTPDRARSPVRVLSGGEQNRLLLARLFSRPANLIVMDEPTNDLDIESLELLEELLLEYTGTVLLVTHDRTFLDNVVSSLLVFEGDGVITEYVGGYSDWLAAGGSFDDWHRREPAEQSIQVGPSRQDRKERKREQQKLERELAALPEKLEAIEQTIAGIHREMATTEFYKQPADYQRSMQSTLSNAESERDRLYARWETLEQTLAE